MIRRLLFATTLSASLAACSAAQIETSAATIEGDIQAGAAAACGIVPAISVILQVAAAVIPGAAAISTIGQAGVNAVEADICSAAPPVASARYKALPRANAGAAVSIGVSAHGVPVSGWRT